MSSNKYIKFVDLSLEIVQSSRLNLYSCKYSKHVYTQHQLLVLVLLKEYISTDYRDFVELLDLMSSIKEKLDLDKIPHYTTLQKFVSRIPSSWYNLILSKTLKLFYSHGEIASITAIDATGFTSSYASHYYSKRTGKLRRSFLKTSIAVDTDKKVILGWKISQKTDHDVKHAKTLIRQSNKLRKSQCYVMDKGYDSEEIHALIREEIKAESIIPLRVRKRKKIKGKYRKQLYLTFDEIRYNKRNIAETTFSVVKRKFGEVLRARKFHNQVKEIKIKLIGYNINKKVMQIICIKIRISTEPEDGSLIKAILFLAAFSFTVSILLGTWTYYKMKRAHSNDPLIGGMNAVKWLTFGFLVLMISIPHIYFPESDRFFSIYLIALTYAGNHVMGKISKIRE